jgi:hypothetical protein
VLASTYRYVAAVPGTTVPLPAVPVLVCPDRSRQTDDPSLLFVVVVVVVHQEVLLGIVRSAKYFKTHNDKPKYNGSWWMAAMITTTRTRTTTTTTTTTTTRTTGQHGTSFQPI